MGFENEKSSPSEDLVARSITIVDENGRSRIRMNADSERGAQFQILSSKGRTAISIAVYDQEPNITFYSPKGRVRLSISCSDDSVGIMYHDSEGKHIALDGVDPTDKPRRIVYDFKDLDQVDGEKRTPDKEEPNNKGSSRADSE